MPLLLGNHSGVPLAFHEAQQGGAQALILTSFLASLAHTLTVLLMVTGTWVDCTGCG